ncbi:MAG: RIP metalloprotease RseP [Alphaproteobacteria bacterium]|nr:RIP metalloprotease RseP [Alphaproteobacteria bacterium]
MEIMSWIANNIPMFLLVLTVLVFVHELGHYLVARWAGVKVEAFSIGFGPELFGWNDRHGTRWRISALPLGGYVKMYGDADPAGATQTEAVAANALTPEQRAVSFHHKSVGRRAAIVAAGPAANFLFAIVVLTGLYALVGQPYTTPTVNTVRPGSAAEAAGLQPGDVVQAIDGTRIHRFEEMQRIISLRPGERLTLSVERGGQTLNVPVTVGVDELTDRRGNVQRIGRLGVTSTQTAVLRHDPVTATWQAMRETWSVTVGTMVGLGQMIAGTRSTDEIGGVLRIADMSGQVSRDGAAQVVWFLALLSINLGLINLFPIPVLDGGHLMFYAAEAIRGKPLGRRVQEWGAMAGLAAVLTLFVFATWNDLVHLRVVAFFQSLIS